MREFQRRRHIRKLLHSRYVIAALIIVCVLLARATWGAYQKYERSKELAATADADFSSLKKREQELTSLTQSIDTDEGKGREIRDRFGLVKSGEKLVVVVDGDSDGSATSDSTRSGIWQWFLDLFR